MLSSLKNGTASVRRRILKERRKETASTERTNIDLDPDLLDLIGLRVFQMHGYTSIVEKEINRRKARGETDRRLRLLDEWQRQMIFSDQEKAALHLAEALTCNTINNVPDEVICAASLFFDQAEIICLTLVILAMNDWHYLDGYSDRVT